MRAAQKIKSPITAGVAKVPVVMQMEALECGAASLAMILAYYEKWVPLEQVRLDCGVSRDGSNARNILRAARSYGLTAKGYRYEPEGLKANGKFPCIIHWNFNHFVVLNGFRAGVHLQAFPRSQGGGHPLRQGPALKTHQHSKKAAAASQPLLFYRSTFTMRAWRETAPRSCRRSSYPRACPDRPRSCRCDRLCRRAPRRSRCGRRS